MFIPRWVARNGLRRFFRCGAGLMVGVRCSKFREPHAPPRCRWPPLLLPLIGPTGTAPAPLSPATGPLDTEALRRPEEASHPHAGTGQGVVGDRIGSPTNVGRERGEAMTDTRERDVAPSVAATIEPACETHRGLVRSVMFAETGTANAHAGSDFHRSHTGPTISFAAAQEAKSFLTRSTAAPKIFGTPQGDGSGIDDEKITLPVTRRTSECEKKFRAPREPQVLDQRQKFCPAAPLVDRRSATAMTRSIER